MGKSAAARVQTDPLRQNGREKGQFPGHYNGKRLAKAAKHGAISFGLGLWAFSVCLWVLAVGVFNTRAWMPTNQTVEEVQSTLSSDDLDFSVRTLEIYKGSMTGSTLTGRKLSEAESVADITMNQFDYIMDENIDTPLIIRIPVAGTFVDGNHPLSVILTCGNGGESSLSTDVLSNVLEIKAGVPDLSACTTDSEIYTGAVAFFAGNSGYSEGGFTQASPQPGNRVYDFVNVGTTGSKKIGAVTLPIPSYTASGLVDIYIQLDYDWERVNAYLERNEERLSEGGFGRSVADLSGSNDLVSITVSVGAAGN